MKSLAEFVNNSNINESEEGFTVYDFFEEKLVNDFYKAVERIWEDGRDSDLGTGLFYLMKYLIKEDKVYKQGILDMCEDIITEFK